jgi:3-dehydroquinate synthase
MSLIANTPPHAPPSMQPAPLRLDTGLEQSRPYLLGHGSLHGVAEFLHACAFDRLFLISDECVHALHGRHLAQHLQNTGADVRSLTVPQGEACKTLSVLESTSEELLRQGASKDSLLLALGGGAVANLVGLSASLLFRGIRFAHLPTTFMAQTDSTLSNKQAVNSARSKNILGTFYAPLFIWADTALLLTEPVASLRSGMVETVKNALIADPAQLEDLDTAIPPSLQKEPHALHDLVQHSVFSKLRILQADPTERRSAMALEYGHTFGHALEKIAAGTLTHGHAVAIGMMLAARVSRRLGMLDEAAVELHRYFLADRLGLSLQIPDHLTTPDLLHAIHADNKRSSVGIRFVLLEKLGKPLNHDTDCLTLVDDRLIYDTIENYRRSFS